MRPPLPPPSPALPRLPSLPSLLPSTPPYQPRRAVARCEFTAPHSVAPAGSALRHAASYGAASDGVVAEARRVDDAARQVMSSIEQASQQLYDAEARARAIGATGPISGQSRANLGAAGTDGTSRGLGATPGPRSLPGSPLARHPDSPTTLQPSPSLRPGGGSLLTRRGLSLPMVNDAATPSQYGTSPAASRGFPPPPHAGGASAAVTPVAVRLDEELSRIDHEIEHLQAALHSAVVTA